MIHYKTILIHETVLNIKNRVIINYVLSQA